MTSLAAAAVLLVLSQPAANSALDEALGRAEKAYNEAEFDAALAALGEAEKAATTDGEKVRVLLSRGVVWANVPDVPKADDAFKQALALDAEAKLPWQVSPKVSAQYEALQQEARKAKADAPTKTALTPSGVDATATSFKVPVAPAVAGGVAVVALGTGVAFGLMSNASVADARATAWASEKAAARDRAAGQATIANVAFAVAATAAATAVVTWVLSDR